MRFQTVSYHGTQKMNILVHLNFRKKMVSFVNLYQYLAYILRKKIILRR